MQQLRESDHEAGGSEAGGGAARSEVDPKREATPAAPRSSPPPAQDGESDDGENGGGQGGGDQRGRGTGQRRKGSKIPLIVLAIVIVIGAIGGGYYWWANRDLQDTDDAYTDGHAITIAPRVSGQVIQLAVSDNQFVHAGDVLIRIDPRDYQTARDQAAANLVIAEAQLANSQYAAQIARVTFPARLAAAQAQVATARATQFRAQTDYQRQHRISAAATTQEAIDQSTAALQQANAQVQQAEAQLKEAEPVHPNIQQADAGVSRLQGQIDQAKAALAQAELNLSYTVVRAPQDGFVSKRAVEQGNFVQSGEALLSLVSPDIWVTANFKETELTRIRPGQYTTIHIDAYPQLHLEGHVDSVQMGSGAQFSTFPAENATGNFVKIVRRVPVKIDIDKGLDPKIPLPLGISVEPVIHLK